MKTDLPHTSQSERAIQRSLDLTRWIFSQGVRKHSYPELPSEPEKQVIALRARMRHALATSFWQAGLEHHAAIVLLCLNHMRSSAIALARCLFDATWKGLWPAYVAPYDELERYPTQHAGGHGIEGARAHA